MKPTARNLSIVGGSGFRERRAERTRKEILRAGLKVFADKGFRAATMDDIALELDATKGLLYYHFKTKDEILRAILAGNQLTGGIDSIFQFLTTMPLLDALKTAVRSSLEMMRQNRELIRFLQVQAMLSGAEAEVVYTEVIEGFIAGVARLIELAKGKGEVRTDLNSRDFAHLMVDSVISFFIQGELFGPKHQHGPTYLDQMIETLYRGIAAKPA